MCSDLKKFAEAESVLRGPLVDPRKELQLEEIISNFGDKAAFALQLLSKLYRKSEKQRQGRNNIFDEFPFHSLNLKHLKYCS